MPNPTTGTVQQEYVEHLKFDAPGLDPTAFPGTPVSANWQDNLLGVRSGIGLTTNWGTPIRTGITRPAEGDNGTSTASAATTLTDANKTGNDAWATNQWAGRTVIASTGAGANTFGRIASNTGTVLTLTAAGWSNGTAQATGPYTIVPALPSGASVVLFRDNWNQGVIRQDGNTESA
jgi:hypothetical protein